MLSLSSCLACNSAPINFIYSSEIKRQKRTFLHFEKFCSFSPLFFLLLSVALGALEAVRVMDVGVCWNAVYSSTGTSSPLSVALVSPSSMKNSDPISVLVFQAGKESNPAYDKCHFLVPKENTFLFLFPTHLQDTH